MLRRCSARVRDTLAGRRRLVPSSPEKKHLQHFDLVLSTFCTSNFNIRLYSFQHFDRKMLNLFKKNVELTLLKC